MPVQQDCSTGESLVSSNPLGYVNHEPFAGFRRELVYGKQSDGSLIHVNAALRGLACGCVCPACCEVLIAYKGRIKTPYFGHQRGGRSGCGRGGETNAHIWAKELLEREKRVMLPAVKAEFAGLNHSIHPPQMFEFARAHLEAALGDIVPDVVLTTKGGDRLLVEVRVTHACGDDKIAKLRAGRLPTVEIDLSAWRTSLDKQAIEAALLTSAPRDWLYNRKIEAAEVELAARAAAQAAEAERQRRHREATRAAQERREAAQEALRVAAAIRNVLDAAASADAERRTLAPVVERSAEFGLEMGFRVPSFGFLVPHDTWQRRLYERCIDNDGLADLGPPTISSAEALRAVEDLIHPSLVRPIEAKVLAGVREEGLRRAPPHEAVERYLGHLCDAGVLMLDVAGGFRLSREHSDRLEKQHQAELARDRRRRRVDDAMSNIRSHLDVFELAVFHQDSWAARPLAPGGTSLADLIDSGGTDWERFQRALLAVERMLGGGPPISDTLDLPIDRHLHEAQRREEARVEDERASRRDRLRARAIAALGSEAATWLKRTLDCGRSTLIAAEQGEAGLTAALARLEQAARERAERLRAEDLASACRTMLEADAVARLGRERAMLFMRNTDPLLPAPPERYCIDKRTLAECRAVLSRRARDSRVRRHR